MKAFTRNTLNSVPDDTIESDKSAQIIVKATSKQQSCQITPKYSKNSALKSKIDRYFKSNLNAAKRLRKQLSTGIKVKHLSKSLK